MTDALETAGRIAEVGVDFGLLKKVFNIRIRNHHLLSSAGLHFLRQVSDNGVLEATG